MTTEYLWLCSDRTDILNGPYSSIQEAEDNAIGNYSENEPRGCIYITTCQYVDPTEWVNVVDSDTILDEMEEYLFHEVSFDDNVFEIEHKQSANDALTIALKKWAKRFVSTSQNQFYAGETVKTLPEVFKEINYESR